MKTKAFSSAAVDTSVTQVEGDGAVIAGAGAGMTSDGVTSFTYLAPSRSGTVVFRVTAGSGAATISHNVVINIGPEPEEGSGSGVCSLISSTTRSMIACGASVALQGGSTPLPWSPSPGDRDPGNWGFRVFRAVAGKNSSNALHGEVAARDTLAVFNGSESQRRSQSTGSDVHRVPAVSRAAASRAAR